jgi:hypothetical protein
MLTRLEAINECLSSVAIAPVSSIDSQHPAFLKAARKFNVVAKKVQSNGGKGWWYNRSFVTLTPALDGTVTIPQYAVVCECPNFPQYIVRGNRLWDRSKRSFVIDTAEEYRIVEALPYEEIPDVAREAIWTRAKYEYYVDEEGSQPKIELYMREKDMSQAQLVAEHLRHEDVNLFDGTHGRYKYPHTRRLPVR